MKNKNTYLQCFISAESQKEVDVILNSLLEKKLVAGGLIQKAPARFWWKGNVVDTDYFNISVFTVEKNRSAIISDVKNNSKEEVPMVWFLSLDGNVEMLQWIDRSLQ